MATTELTDVERALVDHVEHGNMLDLSNEDTTAAEAESRDGAPTVRAWVIRDILLGRLAADPDPRGLRLRGARIAGRIDLTHVTSTIPLRLRRCLLDGGVDARQAQLASIDLTECWIDHPSEPAFDGQRLTASLLLLNRIHVASNSTISAVRLREASIDGKLELSGASLRNDSGPALDATLLHAGQSVLLLHGFTATGTTALAAVRLFAARIDGALECDGATITNESGPAFDAEQIHTGGPVLLRNGFTATGASDLGTVRLLTAQLGGSLECDGANLRNTSGPAIHAERATIDGSVLIRNGFTATGTGNRGTIRLSAARINGTLDGDGATITNESGPAVQADGLHADGVVLRNGFTATGAGDVATIRLFGAQVTGLVECDGATITNESGPALNANGIRTSRSMHLRNGFSATAVGEVAAVRLLAAQIGEMLDCDGATITNESGPAFDAEQIHTGGPVLLRNGFTATGASDLGTVRLLTAQLGGSLECDGANLRNTSGPAIHAERATIDGSVLIRNGFTATGAGDVATIRLFGAQISGLVECDGATITNESGPAFDAERARTGGPMCLRNGFSATGTGPRGAIRMLGARIGGTLECDGATITNKSGPAVQAERIHTDGPIYMRNGFSATGAGVMGAVRLFAARIGGALECDGVVLHNDSGPALHGEQAHTEGPVLLRNGFRATGAGARGGVRLFAARIGGTLDCDGATITNEFGPALNAIQAHIGRSLYLRHGFSAVSDGSHATINLTDTHINGAFVFDPARLEHRTNQNLRLSVDGLTYLRLPLHITIDGWLRLLRDGTADYAAQPYQQLAAVQRAAGHDSNVRKVLMAQRRDQIRRRALTGRAERAWARLTGVTLGYGYQPWRALLGLLGMIAIAVVCAVVLGDHGALARVQAPPTPTVTKCTTVEMVGVGLDLGTPLLTTGARARCETTDSATGQALTVISWVLRLLAWAFATLFIAGFTGAVRKN